MSYPHSGNKQCRNCRHYKTAGNFRIPSSYIWGMCGVTGADEAPLHSCGFWEWDEDRKQEKKD